MAAAVIGTLLEAPHSAGVYRERHRNGFALAVARGDTKVQMPGGPVAYLLLLCADGTFRRYPGRQVVIRDPSGSIATVAGVFTDSVTESRIPSLRPIDGELGQGDMGLDEPS